MPLPFREKDILSAAARAPWLPGAAPALASRRWKLLERETGLAEETYGTARVLAKDVGAPRMVRAEIAVPTAFGRRLPVVVEHLPEVDRYADLGLRFAELPPSSAITAAERLAEALGVVGRVGSLAFSVGCVLSTVHVLEAPDPDRDVSFSDPDVPFSVFIGVQGSPGLDAVVRLAEQIVHECMHLQLTLLEAAHPVTSVEGSEKHWSPWQECMRPTRGVLHGLYVFRVLDAFFADLASDVRLEPGETSYLERRRREIAAETADATASLSGSVELTSFGRAFLDAILAPGEARR